MTPDEHTTLTRLTSYGNMSQSEALEYHRLLNLVEEEAHPKHVHHVKVKEADKPFAQEGVEKGVPFSASALPDKTWSNTALTEYARQHDLTVVQGESSEDILADIQKNAPVSEVPEGVTGTPNVVEPKTEVKPLITI